MNLLTDQWIPVRLLDGGGTGKISLRDLLCGEKRWELCLPRDDMELAAMQLLICITQAIMTPKTTEELRSRIAKPLSEGDYEIAIPPYGNWFQLDHPEYPFMQVRGVTAKDQTLMDKLLPGVTGATNSCFVNQPGLADGLCPGCTAIALFNQASCAPSFGGGFKPGLRGFATPVTTLVQGDHLRRTIWLNVLNKDIITQNLPWHGDTGTQKPTWMEPIKASETIPIQRIGFLRGLLWQPDHIELLPPITAESCSCCGIQTDKAYTAFNKAQFRYTITGTWPHPHSPRIMTSKKGQMKEEFVAFKTSAPAWTQLSRFIVQQQMDETNIEGQQPASVILQARILYGTNSPKLHLLVGGYRNNQASVLERRHEVFTLNHGWDQHTNVIKELVSLGIRSKEALTGALFFFCKGLKDKKANAVKLKGVGDKIELPRVAEVQFYRRSEPTIEDTLARVDFDNPTLELAKLRKDLRRIAEEIFEESVKPYLNDPELIKTMAFAKNRTLRKKLNNLEPQQDKGGNNGATETS